MNEQNLFLGLLRAAYLLNPVIRISGPDLVMKTNKVLTVLALTLALVQVGATYAAVIYDNGAAVNNGLGSDPNFATIIADDFSLAPGANVITDIHWTGAYGFFNTPTEPDDFTINIYSDAAGVPADNPLHTIAVGDPGRVDTGVNVGNVPNLLDVFAYSVNIAAIVLPANTTFWLSIVNDTTADGDDSWLWAGQAGAGNAVFKAPNQPWLLPQGDQFRQDFQLTNDNLAAVPEPASLVLLGLGFVGIIVCRRRKRTG